MDVILNDSLDALTDPRVAPMFWPPSRMGVISAWYGHVPFAHWAVCAHRPRSIVELGTHCGVSYSAFCEAVLRERLDSRCMAVDTWQGDEHAGFYGDEVYAELRQFHDPRYGAFSELRRARFDEALPHVPPGSVDLLHIDGRHFYEDVREDFLSWRDRVSARGIVLFHDTAVHENDFGVWRLWAELRERYPSFEFLHGHGLGVLALGAELDGPLGVLCRLTDGAAIAAVRERFALLGERWIATRDLLAQQRASGALQAELAATKTWAGEAQRQIDLLFPQHRALTEKTRGTRLALAEARCELGLRDQAVAELKAGQQERDSRILTLERALEAAEARAADRAGRHAEAAHQLHALRESAQAQIDALQGERAILLGSTSWKLTAPLRGTVGLVRGRPRPETSPAPVLALPAPERTDLPPAPALPEAAATKEEAAPAQGPRRILFVSGEDHTPGNLYRVERYAEAARALGFDACWMPAAPVGPADLEPAAFVVLWRVPYSAHVQGIIDYMHERGRIAIFDVDDLMFRPEMAVIDIIDGIRSQKFSELGTQAFFTQIGRSLKACDLVTCPTEELAHHARIMGRGAFVLPNGFDAASHDLSRRAMRDWAEVGDDLLRIGYAGGSRTHQRDFAVAAPAIARMLRENPRARLVIFRDPSSGEGLVLMEEFPEFAALADRIEWRDMVPITALPTELARFSVNIAPLEADNPFCEAKSELKFFEAALAGVPTVASPSGPFSRAIVHGVTGFLARGEAEWYESLTRLLGDAALRARMARDAYHVALGRFGPEARVWALGNALALAEGRAPGAVAFERVRYRAGLPDAMPPRVPDSEVMVAIDRRGASDVTVIVPVFNYADYVAEALHSVLAQDMAVLDLVVVDDASPDDSQAIVRAWIERHGARFNRVVVLRHRENAGLGLARNSGFAAAETPFVLPLDADNRLRPAACREMLAALRDDPGAAFAYPPIALFGDAGGVLEAARFTPLRLQKGNYIDAMALVRKSAWAEAGGYDHVRYGWEDYDFWCRLVERGQYGVPVAGAPLADYRVHKASMLHTTTELQDHKGDLVADLERRHPWLDVPLKEEAGR